MANITYNNLVQAIASIWERDGQARTADEKIAYACLRADEVQDGDMSSKHSIFSNAWKAYKRLNKEEESRILAAKGGAYWSVFF